MRLTDFEKKIQREIETWQNGEISLLQQAINWSMRPVDWVVEQVVPQDMLDQADAAIGQFLSVLNDASQWTYDQKDVLEKARAAGLQIERIESLREIPLEKLDPLAQTYFNQNALLAAVEGGGAGLGGAFLVVADIPLLFTINLRLIQQIGACYDFPLQGPAFKPLVLAIYNVAASGSREAKHEAMREMSVAAASFAHELEYRGRRISGTFRDQNRHLPRELAKNIIGRKLGQMIPIAGAAVGAGVNYWFTMQTGQTAYMLFRNLYLERKERL